MEPTALSGFFGSFPQFQYERDEGANVQWKRLSQEKKWPAIWEKEEHEERDEARQKFKEATTTQFNQIYGTEEDDLASWQKLCRRIGFSVIPDELVAARNAVLSVHVNLSDLVDNYDNDKAIQQFKTLEDLRAYTRTKDMYFAKAEAYAGGLLKYLLRELTGTYNGRRRPSQQIKQAKGGKGGKVCHKSDKGSKRGERRRGPRGGKMA